VYNYFCWITLGENKMSKEIMQYRAMMNEVQSLRNFAYSEFCSDSIRKIYLRVANELTQQAIDIKMTRLYN
jgi:hypothetical protein